MIINLFPSESNNNRSAIGISVKMSALFPNSFTRLVTSESVYKNPRLDNLYNTYSTDISEMLQYVIVLDIIAEQHGFVPQCEWWKWKFFKTGVKPV